MLNKLLQRSALPFLMFAQWSEVSSLPEEEPLHVFWRNAVDHNVNSFHILL